MSTRDVSLLDEVISRGVIARVEPSRAMPTSLVGAVLLHACMALLLVGLSHLAKREAPPATVVSEVDIEAPPPPPPAEPETPPPPAPVEPAAAPPPPAHAPAPVVHASAPPPPAPVPSAPPPLLVADEQSNDPSADSAATGTNEHFGGGDTANNGAANQGPVRHADPGGAAGGTGAAPPSSVRDVDLSERPHIDCDEDSLRNFFPEEAQERGVTGMRVQVRVSVDADGHITRAQSLEDPGFGLGRAAERAVMNGCHSTAPRARDGRAVATITTFRLNFELE